MICFIFVIRIPKAASGIEFAADRKFADALSTAIRSRIADLAPRRSAPFLGYISRTPRSNLTRKGLTIGPEARVFRGNLGNDRITPELYEIFEGSEILATFSSLLHPSKCLPIDI